MRRLALAALLVATPCVAQSPVADAAMQHDAGAVRQLIASGADVNSAQGDGMTALHWAAMRGDAELARALIVAGARVESMTRNGGYRPLHLAARGGSDEVVAALLAAGADANAVTGVSGTTALHFAAGQGNAASVTALLDRGATVDVRDGAWSQTPLMWAAAYDRVAVVKTLIARGASISAMSQVDTISVLEARRRAEIAAARPPAAGGRGGAAGGGGGGGGRGGAAAGGGAGGRGGRGGDGGGAPAGRGGAGRGAAAPADTNVAGRNIGYSELIGHKGGFTPLLFAVREGNMETAVALLDAGADVNAVSGGDKTSPLLMATINGHFDLAKLLLERGANPRLASDAGTTPLYATINLQWAPKALYPQPTAHKQQKITYLELMEDLLKAGADVNARLNKHLWYMSYNFDLLGVNTAGATAFWRAAYGTDVPAMRLLKKYGADHTIATYKPAGRQRGADAPAEDDDGPGGSTDPSGLPPVPNGGPGVYPIHAASGVGYGEGYAANAHQHAPDAWVASVKYLVEELGVDVNARDHNGYNPIHHAAARGDNDLILYLVSKGGDVKAVSRRGQTTADMANGPVQRVTPFLETVALLEKLGSKNNHRCRSC